MLASSFISQIQQRFSHEKRARVIGPLMFKERNFSPIRLIRAIRGRTSSNEFFTADYADNADVEDRNLSPIRLIRAIRGRTSSKEFLTADYADNADIKEKNPSSIRLIRVISGQNSSPLRFSLPS